MGGYLFASCFLYASVVQSEWKQSGAKLDFVPASGLLRRTGTGARPASGTPFARCPGRSETGTQERPEGSGGGCGGGGGGVGGREDGGRAKAEVRTAHRMLTWLWVKNTPMEPCEMAWTKTCGPLQRFLALGVFSSLMKGVQRNCFTPAPAGLAENASSCKVVPFKRTC